MPECSVKSACGRRISRRCFLCEQNSVKRRKIAISFRGARVVAVSGEEFIGGSEEPKSAQLSRSSAGRRPGSEFV